MKHKDGFKASAEFELAPEPVEEDEDDDYDPDKPIGHVFGE